MHSFIRVIETWIPSPDGTLLEFGQGLYRAAPGFGAISRQMCFGRGEGLPGHVWDEGRPILLPRLESSYFLRTPAAQAAGLQCAVALPCFVEDRIAAVTVLLCGDEQAGAGAIELWHNDPRINSDMTLVDGWFGGAGGALESLTRDAYLPRGAGLPGLAWQRGETVYMADLAATSSRFLRTEEATEAGLQQGLAWPIETRSNETCVLALLACNSRPIARGIERWVPAPAGSSEPQCVFRSYADKAAQPEAVTLLPALAETLAAGLPRLVDTGTPHGGALAMLPITNAGHLQEVLVLVL